MQVIFLGTGTSGGVPLIGCKCEVCQSTDPRDKRLRTSILVKEGDTTVVVDCGPDFRQQMLRAGVDRLDGVLMTHAHKDHTAGIDDIRAFNFINRKAVDFYCDSATEESIKEQFSYAFKETDYPYLPKMNFIRIGSAAFNIGALTVTPVEVMHANMPVKGFRFGAFTYITDAKTIAPEERAKIRGSKVLVLNALRFEEHYSHLSISQALEIIEDVQPEVTYLIHMSHQFGKYADMEGRLPAGVKIAYDGLALTV